MLTINIQVWEENNQILFKAQKLGIPATEGEENASALMVVILKETMEKYLHATAPDEPLAPRPPKRKRK